MKNEPLVLARSKYKEESGKKIPGWQSYPPQITVTGLEWEIQTNFGIKLYLRCAVPSTQKKRSTADRDTAAFGTRVALSIPVRA